MWRQVLGGFHEQCDTTAEQTDILSCIWELSKLIYDWSLQTKHAKAESFQASCTHRFHWHAKLTILSPDLFNCIIYFLHVIYFFPLSHELNKQSSDLLALMKMVMKINSAIYTYCTVIWCKGTCLKLALSSHNHQRHLIYIPCSINIFILFSLTVLNNSW